VRADTNATARLVRSRFEPFVIDDGERLPSNFSVRRPRRRLGRRSSELYIGGSLARRSPDPAGALDDLAWYLAGIGEPADAMTRVTLRVFERGGEVVLVDLSRPNLTDDRELAELALRELPLWQPQIDAARGRVIAPAAIGSAGGPRNFAIKGVVVSGRTADGAPDIRIAWASAVSMSEEWLDLLGWFAGQERVRFAQTAATALSTIDDLLRTER
jgi:hypothetical protein